MNGVDIKTTTSTVLIDSGQGGGPRYTTATPPLKSPVSRFAAAGESDLSVSAFVPSQEARLRLLDTHQDALTTQAWGAVNPRARGNRWQPICSAEVEAQQAYAELVHAAKDADWERGSSRRPKIRRARGRSLFAGHSPGSFARSGSSCGYQRCHDSGWQGDDR